MSKKLLDLTFEILSLHSNLNWDGVYFNFFECAYKSGEKDLARQIFYFIVLESFRTRERWMIEELSGEEYDISVALKDLGLHDFALKALVEIPQKEKNKGKRWWLRHSHQLPSNHSLCACCHKYVLTCDEIQKFPLENEDSYIREIFARALTQKDRDKRNFLLERLLNEYVDKGPDLTLLFELWVIAEKSGAHFEPLCLITSMGETILEERYFKCFLTIINFRHKEHDSMIEDVMDLFLDKGRFNLAFFLGAKLSSAKRRLEAAFYLTLRRIQERGSNDQEINFLKEVYLATLHTL
ncbi:MAG: hypothetical protein HQK52_22985 [Oligoflexia bacterium]|nr:hypothetical protein [Oligoflexia bacterium]